MGTSKSYEAPPSWGGLKGTVTRVGGAKRGSGGQLVAGYISQNGGATKVARRGAGGAGGSAGRQAARRLAGFAARVAEVGLPQALREAGLAGLIGQPVRKLVRGLIDKFCGPGSTFDEVDARNAMSQLTERILKEAETPEQVESALVDIVHGEQLGALLIEYFGYLVYEEFVRSFYEQVLQRHGTARAESMADDVMDFILKAVKNKVVGVDLTNVKWSGAEGRRVAQDVMAQTLRVFGG
jgi:hypothetical protein